LRKQAMQGKAERIAVVTNKDSGSPSRVHQGNSDQEPSKKTSYNVHRVCSIFKDLQKSSFQERADELPNGSHIFVDFGAGRMKCVVDSGADVSVIHPNMIPVHLMTDLESSSSIMLEAAFGQRITAKLMNVAASIVDQEC